MTVLDQNDNYPTLSVPNKQAAAVNAPIGTTIYSFFGVDPDFRENGTTGLRYEVRDNGNFFIDGQALKNR